MNILFIKNMVCNRCIMVVQNELDKLGLNVKNIKLGEVVLSKEPTAEEKNKLDKALVLLGFELIDDKKSRIIEKIKEKIYTTTKKFLIELLLKQISEEFKNLQCVKVEKKGLYTYNSEAINESVEEMVSLSKIFNNNEKHFP